MENKTLLGFDEGVCGRSRVNILKSEELEGFVLTLVP